MIEILALPLMIMGYAFLITPFIALIPAAIFGWLYLKSRSWFCLIAAVLWLVYTVYEYGMYLRILCSGECNIRVDLLLIYPLLISISILAMILFLLHRNSSPHESENQQP